MQFIPGLPKLENVGATFGRIGRNKFSLACGVLISYQILTNGLGIIPREPYRLTALDPFHRVAAHPENYFQRSPLLPLLGYFTNLTSPLGFAGLSLFLVILGWLTLAVMSRRRFGREIALLSMTLVLAHPVSLVLISWLGTPDSISFALTALLLFVRSFPAVAVICAFGAFNHPVMNVIAPVLLTLRLATSEGQAGVPRLLVGVVGLSVGNLMVVGYLSYFQIETVTRLDFLLSKSLATWIKQNLSLLPYTIYSLHQAVWFALALCVLILRKLDIRYLGLFLISQLLMYGVAFFSVDTTRIFGLMAWAPALHCILYSLRIAEAKEGGLLLGLRGALATTGVVGLLIPGYYIWGGELHTSGFNSFYKSLRGLLTRINAQA